MYSKFSVKSEPRNIQIPEHYSGCAFSATEKREANAPANPPAFLDIGKPSPPPPTCRPLSKAFNAEDKPPKETQEAIQEASKKAELSSCLSSLGNVGNAFPFSHGIGFEELLILGLILLIARNESDHEAILLLGLLLFCG